ncbi:polyketide synthase modules and related proteins [Moorella thermoacetica Y72]|uniref:Polyketide synthase modules and related proteins n=1 Tax=Moorella thermoacetica Y72 TaxID=1325331 RepID=A0A0S6U8K4_NEOTH|nr:polyketide synthase modules and related proteins [Moorella thermoacetica Y72]
MQAAEVYTTLNSLIGRTQGMIKAGGPGEGQGNPLDLQALLKPLAKISVARMGLSGIGKVQSC